MTSCTVSPRGRRAAVSAELRPFRGAAVLLLAATAALAQTTTEKVDAARPALEKWVEARRTISLEKKDWAIGKEMLGERVALIEREIATLRTKIADAEKSIADADKAKAELAAKNELLKAGAQNLAQRAAGLEAKVKALLAQLPNPIKERIRPLSQRLPEKPEETKTSLSERFRNVVGMVNEINKFNREITVESEVRKLADGSSAEVVALYIGLGRAYYYNGGKTQGFTIGGYGKMTPEGWDWQVANGIAADLARAAGMMKNESPAAFVRVPVKVE